MRKMFGKTGCIVLMIYLVTAVSAVQSAALPRVEGTAMVAGSDAIEISGEIFFLAGIVVPINADVSLNQLAQLVSGQILVCTVQETTQGSHRTASCLVGETSVSRAMVRSGAAFAYFESNHDFSEAESLAKQEGLGLWTHDEAKDQAMAFASGSHPPRDCSIKGNKGHEKPYALKYHIPGAAYYSRTRINTRKGESWFCSTALAEAAGFTASRN